MTIDAAKSIYIKSLASCVNTFKLKDSEIRNPKKNSATKLIVTTIVHIEMLANLVFVPIFITVNIAHECECSKGFTAARAFGGGNLFPLPHPYHHGAAPPKIFIYLAMMFA